MYIFTGRSHNLKVNFHGTFKRSCLVLVYYWYLDMESEKERASEKKIFGGIAFESYSGFRIVHTDWNFICRHASTPHTSIFCHNKMILGDFYGKLAKNLPSSRWKRSVICLNNPFLDILSITAYEIFTQTYNTI